MQRLGQHVPAATNTRNSRTLGRVILCFVRVLLKESLWVYLYPPIVARQCLCKHVSAARKHFWRPRFLRSPFRIKEKQTISSSLDAYGFHLQFSFSFFLILKSLLYLCIQDCIFSEYIFQIFEYCRPQNLLSRNPCIIQRT
jgi:hypothetical protein